MDVVHANRSHRSGGRPMYDTYLPHSCLCREHLLATPARFRFHHFGIILRKWIHRRVSIVSRRSWWVTWDYAFVCSKYLSIYQITVCCCIRVSPTPGCIRNEGDLYSLKKQLRQRYLESPRVSEETVRYCIVRLNRNTFRRIMAPNRTIN